MYKNSSDNLQHASTKKSKESNYHQTITSHFISLVKHRLSERIMKSEMDEKSKHGINNRP